MGALMVWTDPSLKELGATENFGLDLEADLVPDDQDKSNDFVATLPMDVRLAANSAVFMDGTQWGGLVQGRASDTDVPGVLEWRGRTWLGVLADRVLLPNSGQAAYTSSGTVAECIADLVSRLGLSTLFAAGECPTLVISYTHKRYPTGMDALYDMLASADLKPVFEAVQDGGLKVLVGAEEIATATEAVDGEHVSMSMQREFTPYNHLVGLGEGEGTARIVQHWYADADGNVSQVKTITGLAERTYRYDYPNADAEELAEYSARKLEEFQGQGSVDVTLPDGSKLRLGDMVRAYDPRIDESVTARVTKCVVKVNNGIEECAWSAE